jgi:uncharacterized protein
MEIDELYVIMKIVERCNLNCSYCYYYTADNREVMEREALMGEARLDEVVDYIERAVSRHAIGRVVFGLHGGEPTLAKARKVREFCTKARQRLSGRTQVRFALQTNGVHLPDDWLALIASEQMGVGISIDGDQAVHDRYRVDHKGRGSYERVRANLARLLEVERETAGVRVTALAVLGPDFNGVAAYDNLVETLGIRHVKLLLEDRTADAPLSTAESASLLQRLCDMFDRWMVRDAGQVKVIPFDQLVRGVMRKQLARPLDRRVQTMGMAILSDGRVRIQDDFMVARDWFWRQATVSAKDSSLADYALQPHVREIMYQAEATPGPCRDCEHAAVCRGGEVAHRHRNENGFDNRSVYCDVLFGLCRHVEERLALGAEAVSAAGAGGLQRDRARDAVSVA